jgi:hypothetical protein
MEGGIMEADERQGGEDAVCTKDAAGDGGSSEKMEGGNGIT